MPSFTPVSGSCAQVSAPFEHVSEHSAVAPTVLGSHVATPWHSPRTHSGAPEPSLITHTEKFFLGSTLGSRGSPQAVVPTLHCSGSHLASVSPPPHTSLTAH